MIHSLNGGKLGLSIDCFNQLRAFPLFSLLFLHLFEIFYFFFHLGLIWLPERLNVKLSLTISVETQFSISFKTRILAVWISNLVPMISFQSREKRSTFYAWTVIVGVLLWSHRLSVNFLNIIQHVHALVLFPNLHHFLFVFFQHVSSLLVTQIYIDNTTLRITFAHHSTTGLLFFWILYFLNFFYS